MDTFGAGRDKFLVANDEAIRESVRSKLIQQLSFKYPELKNISDLVKMPDLTALIEAAHQIIYAPSVQYQDVFFWNVYKVNEDKIIVIPEAVEQAKSHFRAYAETSEEIEKLRKVKNLCRTLDSFLIHGCDPDKLNISNVCYFDRFSNRFEPSSQFIKFSI